MEFVTPGSPPPEDGVEASFSGTRGALIIPGRSSGYPEDFCRHIERVIAEARESGTLSALILISIDNLAMILSGYGHQASEDVCATLTAAVHAVLGPNDIFCRLQKDQFGALIGRSGTEEIAYLTERVGAAIQQMGYRAEYGSMHVLPSIVCIELAGEGVNAEEALDQAFLALRNHRGTVHQTFEGNQREAANSRQEMGLASYLTKAIREHRLRLAYQPVIESATGHVAHYEALLRIVGPDGKIASAGALIPIAERMGLIGIIDELVLDMVVEELVKSPDVRLALNVSNLTAGSRQWLNQFKQRVSAHSGLAERLIVEITETAVHRDLKKTAYFVTAIQAMGAQVALDDFGSGYTSFRQLKSLSVDMVKIDGVFIRDLVDSNDNRLFVKTMLDFTNGFGLKAVAEFVETGETAKLLMELGVEYMQGYYFGRPENHRSWLKNE